jgi:hypothetical protein
MSSWDKAQKLLEDKAIGTQQYNPQTVPPNPSEVSGGIPIHLQPQDWYFVVDMLGSMAEREPESKQRNYDIINDIWYQIKSHKK